MLAYHVALLKNCDVDKPRNLAKSVTVEWPFPTKE
jgi:glucosamine--fructose-6-phosphate aminotransferase (isomerizing)